jgi:hypothetical protein
MAETTIFVVTDDKGREFKLIGDLEDIKKQIFDLQTSDRTDEGYVYYGNGDERPSTDEDQFRELVDVSEYFDEEFDWTEIINSLPKKKNGTFAKGRVKVLHRARSLSQLWEDSYGYAAPEVRIKVRGDLEAYVEFGIFVEQW